MNNAIYQPATTDRTIEGLKRARNAIRLWADDALAAKWLMADGDFVPADRKALYESELEA
jgi:hypothetical protein